MKKLGLFFGAGAEIDYGLPTGGKFALDIFRISKEEDKNDFKEKLMKINPQSILANKWLPKNYDEKNIYVFGKANFEDLISSSLENKRYQILEYLKDFDENVERILERWQISKKELEEVYFEEYKSYIGDNLYSQQIQLNDKLSDDVKLFESDYFSAFLKVLEKSANADIKKIVQAILELLLGALGQSLVSRLNDEIFKKTPPQFNVFDDIGGIFSMNYSSVGKVGMEIVIEEKQNDVTKDDEITAIFYELGKNVLEDVYSSVLDYQSLIDSHYRYLYNPKSHWAKFTRIAVFLLTVRRYIANADKDMTVIKEGPGYYHDLIKLIKSEKAVISTVGTTNYNNLIKDVFSENQIQQDLNLHALNGSVDDFYDPYKNRIIIGSENVNPEKEIVVPFIFTQSGVKPLTSITMSQRYVTLYNDLVNCDVIGVLGYGFNGDDGHINGLFRSLIEEENKEVHIFHYGEESSHSLERMYQEKLRIDSRELLTVHVVDGNRKVGNDMWYKYLL